MQNVRDRKLEELQEWLSAVCKKVNMKPTPLANHIGVSPSTLTRPLNDPNYSGTLSTPTIAKLVSLSGIPAPASISGIESPGFNDGEIVHFDRGNADISMLSATSNAQDIWTVCTDLLDLEGYLPGDHVVIDMNESPRRGDIVMAQIYHGDSAETVFRKFDPPFLVASTTNRKAPKPVYVDNEHVVIMGVAMSSWRTRDSRNVA